MKLFTFSIAASFDWYSPEARTRLRRALQLALTLGFLSSLYVIRNCVDSNWSTMRLVKPGLPNKLNVIDDLALSSKSSWMPGAIDSVSLHDYRSSRPNAPKPTRPPPIFLVPSSNLKTFSPCARYLYWAHSPASSSVKTACKEMKHERPRRFMDTRPMPLQNSLRDVRSAPRLSPCHHYVKVLGEDMLLLRRSTGWIESCRKPSLKVMPSYFRRLFDQWFDRRRSSRFHEMLQESAEELKGEIRRAFRVVPLQAFDHVSWEGPPYQGTQDECPPHGVNPMTKEEESPNLLPCIRLCASLRVTCCATAFSILAVIFSSWRYVSWYGFRSCWIKQYKAAIVDSMPSASSASAPFGCASQPSFGNCAFEISSKHNGKCQCGRPETVLETHATHAVLYTLQVVDPMPQEGSWVSRMQLNRLLTRSAGSYYKMITGRIGFKSSKYLSRKSRTVVCNIEYLTVGRELDLCLATGMSSPSFLGQPAAPSQ